MNLKYSPFVSTTRNEEGKTGNRARNKKKTPLPINEKIEGPY